MRTSGDEKIASSFIRIRMVNIPPAQASVGPEGRTERYMKISWYPMMKIVMSTRTWLT